MSLRLFPSTARSSCEHNLDACCSCSGGEVMSQKQTAADEQRN